jgi:hypothetical protein
MIRSCIPNRLACGLVVALGSLLAVTAASSEPAVAAAGAAAGLSQTLPRTGWRLASERESDGFAWLLYEEEEATPGRPAFRVEADLDAAPAQAAAALMDSLADETPTTSGEHRRLLERSAHAALVHTFIDLPFMFSDRELVIRIEHSHDPESGVHSVRWRDENGVLPPPENGVLRLESDGFWAFHPTASGGTHAIYVSRAEVGGSLPKAVSDRLMRGQAVDSVLRLRTLLARRVVTGDVDVAASPPDAGDTP